MPTTTNYGWTTPADTDLVKDGASAIRTLGTAIDTTVFTNAGNAIAKTIVDAKGDIIAATAADTVARLAVGANDTVLTADSSTATGLKWAAPAAGGMTLISTTSLSGASVTLSSIPATYNHLQLVIRDILPANIGANLNLRLNGDSGANRYVISAWGAGASTQIAIDEDALKASVSQLSNTVTENLNIANFYDYTNTTTFKYGTMQGVSINFNNTADITRGAYHLFYNQTPAISSITLFMSSGNITSGTALLYGVK